MVGGRWRQPCGRGESRVIAEQSAVVACVAASLGAQSAEKRTRRHERRGAIPILQGVRRARPWSACRSNSQRSSATVCFSRTKNSGSDRRIAEKRSDLDDGSFSVDDVKADVVAMGDVGGQTSPPPFWLERGEPSRQSSLVVDPPDGHLPPMTPDGLRRVATTKNTSAAVPRGFNAASELGPYDRCISRGVLGSMFPVVYNNGNQFIQIPGYVVLRNEMIHETRVVPLDNRPQLSPELRVLHGRLARSLRGNTLVVHTTNFNGATGAHGQRQPRHRRRRARTDGEVHAHGPRHDAIRGDGEQCRDVDEAMDRVISAQTRARTIEIFEYACHEGNHAMSNILSGSRARRSRDR